MMRPFMRLMPFRVNAVFHIEKSESLSGAILSPEANVGSPPPMM